MKKLYFFLIALMVGVAANAADFYLRGGMNGWGSSAAWQFKLVSGDDYILENVTIGAGIEFKVADASWGTINYGGRANMVVDTDYELTYNSGSNCSLKDKFEGNVKFNLASHVIRFEGKSTEDTTIPDFFLRGSMNGWEAVSAWQFILKEGDEYAIENVTIPEGATFKVADADWGKVNYGYNEGEVLKVNTDYTLVKSGADMTLGAAFTGNVYYKYSTATIRFVANGETPDTPDTPETKKYTVSYNNGVTAWDAVYVYMWNADGTKNNAAWPGVKMDAPDPGLGTPNVWTYEVELDWTPKYVIFGNGTVDGGVVGVDQTEDLEFVNEKVYGEAAALPVVYAIVAGDNSYLGTPVTNNADLAEEDGMNLVEKNCAIFVIDAWTADTKFAVMAQQGEDVKFYSNSAALENGVWNENLVESATPAYMTLPEAANGKKVTLTFAVDNKHFCAEWEGGEPVVPGEKTKYTVSYNNGKTQWDEVYVYMWNGADANAAWPGVKMDAPVPDFGKANVWTYEVELDWTPKYVIFGNGTVDGGVVGVDQTEDLEFVNEKEYGEAAVILLAGLYDADGAPLCDYYVLNDAEYAEEEWVAPVNGCAEFVVNEWVAGTEFFVGVANVADFGSEGTIYTAEAELQNGAWVETVANGTVYMTLPESAKGKKVTITYAFDNSNICATWNDGESSKDYAYLMGINDDWAEGIAAEVGAKDENCAIWEFSTWDGSAFKVKYNDVWYTISGELLNNEWTATETGGMDNNIELPADVKGQPVRIVFAVDSKDMCIAWGELVGIEGINADANAVEFYNLQGVRVANPVAGMYIRVANGKVSKVFVK